MKPAKDVKPIKHVTTAIARPSCEREAVVMTYHPLDPYAVRLEFPADVWRVSRDILGNGVLQEDGYGDFRAMVHIGDPDVVVLAQVDQEHGRRAYHFPRGDLVAFLEETFNAVPSNTEHERYTDAWFDNQLRRLFARTPNPKDSR